MWETWLKKNKLSPIHACLLFVARQDKLDGIIEFLLKLEHIDDKEDDNEDDNEEDKEEDKEGNEDMKNMVENIKKVSKRISKTENFN